MLGSTSYSAYYNCLLTNPQKGIWSYYNNWHDQSTMGIDPMNNISIIIRILFAVTLFQHSPLTRRVFYNSIRRERPLSSKTSGGQHHQYHLGWRIYKSSEVFFIGSIIILERMPSSSTSICINKMIPHHSNRLAHHSTTLAQCHNG